MLRREQKSLWARCTLYVLAAYILFQIVWWGSHIIHLTSQINHQAQRSNVYAMVLGEGSVFALLLLSGFFFIHRTLRKEFHFAKVQSAFLLSVTHELKTPVSALKLGLETIRNRPISEDQRQQLLTQMAKEAMRLQLLSDNIVLAARLDMRQEELLQEAVDLNAVIHKVNKMLVQDGQSVVCTLQPEAVIFGDDGLIHALYSNVLENALKYNRPNGVVRIQAEVTDDAVFLSITDQGKGIPMAERTRVKSKFYRIDNELTRQHQGTGLGLFIVDQVAKLHKAKWEINDAPEGGCEIKIKFKRNHHGKEE